MMKRRWLSWIMGKAAGSYPERVADQVGVKLERMAQNPKGLQLRELVLRLRPRIEAAQAAGYSLEDIVGVFQSEQVSMTASTLKTYLREAKRDGAVGQGEGDRDLGTIAQAEKPSTKVEVGREKKTTQTKPKPDLTNTNEAGFQVMRADDDL
jgi:hypothetical protein